MTAPTDASADYEIYWLVFFKNRPAMMQHDWNDQVEAKFMGALPLLRIMSGSDLNPQVEQRWMEVALHQIGPDGLAYMPSKGRPWDAVQRFFADDFPASNPEQDLIPFYNGRLLEAIVCYALRDEEGPWRDVARGIVDGLNSIAANDGQRSWFWPTTFHAEKVVPPDAKMPTLWYNCELRAVPLGLMYAYRLLSYEPALDLAGRLNTYLRDLFFTPEGKFIANREGEGRVHFHAHTASLLAMLEYAHDAKDTEMLEFVCHGYEYAKSEGETLTGYFPEFLQSPELEHSEICEVADMVALALKLSEYDVMDCWEDADRWLRNMFAEGQLTRADWIDSLTAGQPTSAIDSSYQSVDRVAERNLGAFAGWPTMNDWYALEGPGIMHCCTGNAARTLYQAWERILEHGDGRLHVHLLLNRASPWADVDSHLPYRGQVDVKAKEDIEELSVRIPAWADVGAVEAAVGDVRRQVAWNGRYAKLGPVPAGVTATVWFPIFERSEHVRVEEREYGLVLRGNDVVHIDPSGVNFPLYQRDHYRTDQTRWREIERFVSAEKVTW